MNSGKNVTHFPFNQSTVLMIECVSSIVEERVSWSFKRYIEQHASPHTRMRHYHGFHTCTGAVHLIKTCNMMFHVQKALNLSTAS